MQARGQPRQGGTIKSGELMHKRGVWHLSLTLECPTIERESGNAACGLDWGVETFAMLAFPDGASEPIENPRLYRTQKAKELELERIRDRRKRRSVRRRKASIRCGTLKAKNARPRLDFHHQTSAKLVRRFGLIATEKLEISKMTWTAKGTVEKPGKNVAQKAGLNREILDTGPAAFLTMVRYKAEEARSLFMEAPTAQAETLAEVSGMRQREEKVAQCANTSLRRLRTYRTSGCRVWPCVSELGDGRTQQPGTALCSLKTAKS
jgi:putative transposase